MKRRFLKRRITSCAVQSIRFLKKQKDRHDWASRLAQGKSVQQNANKYVPYFIAIADMKIGPESLKLVKEIKQILTISARLEKRKSGHVVQIFRTINGMSGWFNYDIYNSEEKAREMCGSITDKIKTECRYVFNKSIE